MASSQKELRKVKIEKIYFINKFRMVEKPYGAFPK
jgi:hypothetical protein